jgi:hypothetical protein
VCPLGLAAQSTQLKERSRFTARAAPVRKIVEIIEVLVLQRLDGIELHPDPLQQHVVVLGANSSATTLKENTMYKKKISGLAPLKLGTKVD